ncbi:hypothetical protein TOPH_03687 [Tolypocladium ophioglossoides CBS 100239]|uniref:Uncharacterized protein n=1 Tax=Tolypocladium ophioglossoides (strain CBS 100239) TaxID=1163406 RepID=A0A0L0NC62_TOLOC|nr:hypothetical protein TOPH_03687 [Tolypocladium ophioglossoides CBS 100239]
MAPLLNFGLLLALAGLAPANPLPPRDDVNANAERGQDFAVVLDNDHAGASASASASGECTKLILKAPDWTWGPTKTLWTTTATSTRIIDCGGCDKYTMSYLFFGVPPVVIFDATTTATGPSITIEVKCGHPTATITSTPAPKEEREPSTRAANPPSPHYYQANPNAPVPTVATPAGVSKPGCTSSTMLPPEIPVSTYTKYPSTVTSTSTVECGSCAVAWSTAVINFFAPIKYTATVSPSTPSTKTDFVCARAAATGY